MNKIRLYIVWACLLTLIACTTTSNLCRHDLSNGEAFSYRNKQRKSGAEIGYASIDAVTQAKVINWQMLKDVTYKTKWNEEFQLDFMYPVFGEKVKKLKGQQLTISGYMVPLNIEEGLYAVSRYTYAACYFCGKSGPESVVSLKFAKKPGRFKLDQYVTVSGTLDLNDTNVNDFIYIFRNAVALK